MVRQNKTQDQTLAPHLAGCVNLDSFPNLPAVQFPHLQIDGRNVFHQVMEKHTNSVTIFGQPLYRRNGSKLVT